MSKIIPNLPTRKVNIPKTAAKNATFNPPANTANDTSPTASIESIASIKPISFDRLYQSINKYMDECIPAQLKTVQENVEEKSDFIFVRSDRKMIKVNFSEIIYIESLGDYIKIILDTKNIVTRESISSIEAKLPKSMFLRTHRSFIASVKHIVSFTNEYIETNNKAIPISRSYKTSVINKLENL